jgi:hypothetical protein
MIEAVVRIMAFFSFNFFPLFLPLATPVLAIVAVSFDLDKIFGSA